MSTNSTLKDNITIVLEVPLSDYDTNGAMIYIMVVLFWYSIGIVFILGMQISTRSEEIEDSARRRERVSIRNLRDDNNTREILEVLSDKQYRERLWNIYFYNMCDTKDRSTRAETVRIRQIEKKLAAIKRNHRLTHDTFVSSTKYISHQSNYRRVMSELPTEATSSTLRRRSSLDQQTLDRWKELADQSKPHEQLTWAFRKIMIRKHFRRNTKKSSTFGPTPLTTNISTTDDEQIGLILLSNPSPKLSHGQTESDLSTITSTIDERQNPYLSYFYIPSSQPITLTPKFLPS